AKAPSGSIVVNIRAAAAASQNRFMEASFTRQSPPSRTSSPSRAEQGVNALSSWRAEVTSTSHRASVNLTDAFFIKLGVVRISAKGPASRVKLANHPRPVFRKDQLKLDLLVLILSCAPPLC